MRIALVSDIHGNLPALEAVLADIREQGVELTYHLGDLVGYGPFPDAVVECIANSRIFGVAGNYDSTVALRYKHCGCAYEDPWQEELSHLSFQWTVGAVSPETRRFLAALPFRLDVRPAGGHRGGPTLVLVHAAPTLNTLYWTEDRPDDFCRKMITLAGVKPGDVLAFGHTHLPWHRVVDGVHLVNAGSVGRPKDGDPRAGYTLLDVEEGTLAVRFRRVTYDVERAAAAIESSALPRAFADQLRSGDVRSGRPGSAS